MSRFVKASVGKVEITPEERAPLQGYDPDTNISDPAKGILDPLYARILILDDGQSRSVLVSVDCCLPNEVTGKVADPSGRPDEYREFINTFPSGTRASWAKAAGTSESCVSVNATHTHTAPAHYCAKYTVRIELKIRELSETMVPVQMSVGVGSSAISAFRRPKLLADFSVPVDQVLHVLWIETYEGEPLAEVVNYAVHPTSLRNPTDRISGDIVGLAMNRIEEQVGDGFISLFIQGFSGDVCPIYGDNGPKEDTYPEVIKGASVFSADIMKALDHKQRLPVSRIKTSEASVTLPTRQGFYIPHLNVNLMGIAIGDLAILSISGEVFNGYIEKMVNLSPFQYTMLSGVANGYAGYLPTYAAFHDGLGGYEMNTTPYTDEVEKLLLSAAAALFANLKDGK